jgi:hypothetical protein
MRIVSGKKNTSEGGFKYTHRENQEDACEFNVRKDNSLKVVNKEAK